MRSDLGDIPSNLMVEYYSRRGSKGGLIVSEATPVSIRGYGYAGAPGIYSDHQIQGCYDRSTFYGGDGRGFYTDYPAQPDIELAAV